MPQNIQSILPTVQAAIHHYEMIQEGDKIAVGVSGGKDSVALLAALARIQSFSDIPFSIVAITLDPCFDGETDYSAIANFCKEQNIPYVLKPTRLWDAIVEAGQEEHPCSLCAKMRRGALHQVAQEQGCNVVALGHHMDDAAETFWMNLTTGGTLGSFSPKTYLDRRGLTLIRPLVFVKEKQIEGAVIGEGLPVVKSHCPADGNTARQDAKDQLRFLSAQHGDMVNTIVKALQKSHISNW